MSNLNLLEEKEGKKIKTEMIYFIFKNIISILVVAGSLIGVLLLSSRLILENHFVELSAQSAYLSYQRKWMNEEIYEVNRLLKNVDQIQKNYWPWSFILKEIAEIVPQGTKLSYLDLDKETKEVILKGKAQKRDNFLTLKRELESSPLFSDITSPLSNILFRENIDFEFEGRLNPEFLSQ